MSRRNSLLLFAFLTFSATPCGVLAQSSLDPGQLPSSTVFYLAWHGTPAGEARKANSLLALWDDAEFAQVRGALIEEMMSDSDAAKKQPTSLTKDEIAN